MLSSDLLMFTPLPSPFGPRLHGMAIGTIIEGIKCCYLRTFELVRVIAMIHILIGVGTYIGTLSLLALLGGNHRMLLSRQQSFLLSWYAMTMEPNLARYQTIMDTLGHSASSRHLGVKIPSKPIIQPAIFPPVFKCSITISKLITTHSIKQLQKTFHNFFIRVGKTLSRNPFFGFGDYHPYLFTNLLRSLLNEDSDDGDDFERSNEKGLSFPLAWNRPSTNLVNRVEQIECGLRSMVPCFVDRARKAQCEFIKRGAVDWVRCKGKEEASKVIGGGVVANNDELVSVFLDANRLRRNILIEIMGATDLYQAALYLEGLAKFFIGFRDFELVKEFEQCKIPLSLDS
ncbi:hypothetical protein IFM89_014164 [Coptis chinensis]|uniref:DOG1 domain-containing protein n=1 Tax=Coptis chinensis TaxID=261450 RepID=A0A835IAN7_9MAGN|nr:hypothetical protein IFM89_014164 [Coptis chinensis]